MITSAIDLLALAACIISVIAAVVSVYTVRRGADAGLQGDLNELAGLVDKLSREQRRERMQRVRRGESAAPAPSGEVSSLFPVPPDLRAVESPAETTTSKDELRRRVFAARGKNV
jgi:hypothetical protein